MSAAALLLPAARTTGTWTTPGPRRRRAAATAAFGHSSHWTPDEDEQRIGVGDAAERRHLEALFLGFTLAADLAPQAVRAWREPEV